MWAVNLSGKDGFCRLYEGKVFNVANCLRLICLLNLTAKPNEIEIYG